MTNPPPYPGGQQPHDPYQTGQPYQAGQPYQQGQPYQPGQSPYPAYPAGGFTPPPKKSSLKWLWILLGVFGVIGVLIVAGVIALAVFATKDNVSDSDDVAIGDCVRVERTTGNDVKPKKLIVALAISTSPWQARPTVEPDVAATTTSTSMAPVMARRPCVWCGKWRPVSATSGR